jgi:hypothetical protein
MISLDYWRIYWALVRRDLIVIKKRYVGALIDAAIPLGGELLLFGAFFPLMGVPTAAIASIYVGSQTMSILFIGSSFGFRNAFDLKYTRFIDYRLTLPLPKVWLFASTITYFMLEAALISFPLLTVGIYILSFRYPFAPTWPLFFSIYPLTLCLYGLMFLGLSLYYDFDWYIPNIWPRRLSFVLTFSALLYAWQSVYLFSPLCAYIMLASPLTYVAEGFRSTLIGGNIFLPPWLCIGAVLGWIIAAVWLTRHGIAKRLDPV